MVDALFGIHLSVAALILRVAIGGLFIIHGYPKLGAQQRKQGAEWLKSIGVPGGFLLFGGVVEFFGGIAILLGIFTSMIAVLFALWMLSTTWLSAAKMKKKFVAGYELDIILLLASLALAAIGGGIFSIDYLLRI
jgi:putative oxidoreductase